MADVDGQIVLGLDIVATAGQISSDLDAALKGIKKEIILSAKIGNIDFGNASAQIRNVTNQINREFSSTLNVIDLLNNGIGNLSTMLQGAGFSKASVSTVAQDLQKMNVQISNITNSMNKNGNITLKINGTDELQRAVTIVREYDAETGKLVNSSKSFGQSFESGAKAASNFAKSVEQIKSAISNNQIEASISKVVTQYEKLGSTGHEKLAQIKTDIEQLKSLQQTMATNTDNTSVLVSSYEQYEQVLVRVKNNLDIVSTAAKKEAASAKEAAQATNTIFKSQTLSNQIQTWMNQNAEAAQKYGERLRELQSILSNNSNPTMLASARAEFAKIKSEAQAAGTVTNQFANSIKDTALQLLGLSSGIMVIRKIISTIQEGVNTVIELDTALIDLKKTTSMSGAELSNFYKEANTSAKELGVTTKDIIQSAADWSRLGYNDKNSATTMARMAAQFAAISPGVNIETATTGLISVMKAYGIEAEDVLDGVMSKINIIGNTAATSNDQIITGLQNSASAMKAMGSTLDENIALFTAAQEIIQDDSKVGNALRSISMRIRGYDEETEELSADLTNIAGEVYDLTKVTEDAKGISLFTDESQEHYKSIYQYLQEISGIYDKLGEKQQQELMEKLFGKNRASIGQAIIQNFKAAEKAMDDMANSAGSADAEMEIIMDSLEYKLNALKETGTGIFQNLFQQEDIGVVIDVLTSVLEVIDNLTEHLGLFGTAALVLGGGGVFKSLA